MTVYGGDRGSSTLSFTEVVISALLLLLKDYTVISAVLTEILFVRAMYTGARSTRQLLQPYAVESFLPFILQTSMSMKSKGQYNNDNCRTTFDKYFPKFHTNPLILRPSMVSLAETKQAILVPGVVRVRRETLEYLNCSTVAKSCVFLSEGSCPLASPLVIDDERLSIKFLPKNSTVLTQIQVSVFISVHDAAKGEEGNG